MSVEEAVEDIIARGVVELRKNAFGDDVDDVKSLAWTQEQAWKVIKVLSHITTCWLDFRSKETRAH